jgi:hypothetical protein
MDNRTDDSLELDNQQLKDEAEAVVGPDETGCVKWFDEKKCYGFITPDAGALADTDQEGLKKGGMFLQRRYACILPSWLVC